MNDATDRLQRARDELRILASKLAVERDELRLKMHLARAEVRDEFEAVEQKWNTLQHKLSAVGESASGAGRDVAAAGGLLGDEIRHAYQKIRDALKS